MATGWKGDISTDHLCGLTSMSKYEVEACLNWLESNKKISRSTVIGPKELVRVLEVFFDVFKELPGNWRLDVWIPHGATE